MASFFVSKASQNLRQIAARCSTGTARHARCALTARSSASLISTPSASARSTKTDPSTGVIVF